MLPFSNFTPTADHQLLTIRLLEETLQYSPSQYQHSLLYRVAAASTDPRIVLVGLNVVIDILEQFWDPACKQSRAPSMHGFPQGCAIRERLDHLHNNFRPYWENTDVTETTMPKTMAGINALRVYRTWYMHDELGSDDDEAAPTHRFSVHECVALTEGLAKLNSEADTTGNAQDTAEVHLWGGKLVVDVVGMHATDYTTEPPTIASVSSREFSVSKDLGLDAKASVEGVAPPDDMTWNSVTGEEVPVSGEDFDEEEDGGGGEDESEDFETLNVSQIADRYMKQVARGRVAARNKSRHFDLEYYRAPLVLGFMTVAGTTAATGRLFLDVVLRNAPNMVDTWANDIPKPNENDNTSKWFEEILNPSQAEAKKGITRKAIEMDIVYWISRFGLLQPKFANEWKLLTTELRHIDNDMCAGLGFPKYCPKLHEVLSYTLDAIGSQDYLAETVNSTLESTTDQGASDIIQDCIVAYVINVLSPINNETKWLGRDREAVEAARQMGEDIRLRAVDTHEKRIAQVKAVNELISSRYTDKVMSQVMSATEYAQLGTGHHEAELTTAVLKAAAEKRKSKALDAGQLAAVREATYDQYHMKEIEFDGTFSSMVTTGNMYEANMDLLTRPEHWASVHPDDLSNEVRYVLPHADARHLRLGRESKLLQESFKACTSWKPPEEGEKWDEDTDETLNDTDRLWCICQVNTADSNFDERPMIYCEGVNCRRRSFHLDCLGRKGTPKGVWYCDECDDEVRLKKARWCAPTETPATGNEPLGGTEFACTPNLLWATPPMTLQRKRALAEHDATLDEKRGFYKEERKKRTAAAQRYVASAQKRQKTPAFVKKNIKAYVALWLGGRRPVKHPEERPTTAKERRERRWCDLCKCGEGNTRTNA